MSQDAFQDRLLDLAYGELSPREAREVEAHAASCPACRAELARIRETRRIMAALPDEPAPEAGERILLAAAREAARARRRAPLLPRWGWALSMAATLAVVGAVSYRILAMRGPAERAETALLGNGAYQAAPAPEAPPPAPAGDAAEAEHRREAPMADHAERAPAPPRAAAPAAKAAPRELAERERGAAFAPPPSPPGAAAAPPAAPAPEAGPPSAPAASAQAARREDAVRAAPAPQPAPAPSRAEAAPPRSDARRRAAAPATDAGADAQGAPQADALASYGFLRSAGRLRGEIRTFTDCPGEAWRKVETDPDGRVVSYVREGTIGGRRLRVEAIYGADGRLARTRVRDLADAAAPVRDARPGEVPGTPEDAAAATADAPPRCGD
jgi:hypothetical protein